MKRWTFAKILQDPFSPMLYQAPRDITQPHVIDYYRRYFNQTKLIVGLRHPILWFESLYSKYQLQHDAGKKALKPLTYNSS